MNEEQSKLPLEEDETTDSGPLAETEQHPDETIDTRHSVEPPQQGKTIMLIGSTGSTETASAQGHMVEYTVSMAPSPSQEPDKNTVSVRIKYPSAFKKQKFFKDGDVKEVAKETADQFVSAGFATIIKEPKK